MQPQNTASPFERALAGCAYMASGFACIYLMPTVARMVQGPVYVELLKNYSVETAIFWSEISVWFCTGICFFGMPAILMGLIGLLLRPRIPKGRKF